MEFNFLGFDIRIHPGFFIISVLFVHGLVSGPEINAGVGVLMGVAIFFVAILVHELGHALAYRYYGLPARIVLYWMGGLAISEASFGRRQASLNNYQRIVVSLAGPVAGLLLGGILLVIAYRINGEVDGYVFNFIPIFAYADRTLLQAVLLGGIFVNIFLNIINLVPIYPLDGGQISRNLFEIFDPWDGTRKSIILSMATAVLCGVYGYSNQEAFIAIFCFYMAYQNYQMLNVGGQRRW
ncbi:site-2 protease family protein [bacterium]|nr:site-2 protease family protein [bacterium]